MAQNKIERFKMEIDSDGSGNQWVSPWPDDKGEWVYWQDVAPYNRIWSNDICEYCIKHFVGRKRSPIVDALFSKERDVI